MKSKYLKRILCLGIVGIMTASLCACNEKTTVTIEPMEKEEADALGFNFLGGEDVMPISGYYGPAVSKKSFDGQSLPNYLTDEIFTLISDAGLNMIGYSDVDYGDSSEMVYTLLDYAEKYNLGIYVYDDLISDQTPGNPPSTEEIAQRLTAYCDYPAFCGMYVVDEPGTLNFKPTADQKYDVSTFAPIFQSLRELGIVGGGNMHPLYNNQERDKYDLLLEEYCSTCDPYYLCFDFYVWDVGKKKEDYFYNLDVIRKYAEKSEIPFWCYIQAGSQWGDGGLRFDSDGLYPSEGQMNWNVNTSLAYGAKGIQYFPIIQPISFSYAETTDFDFQRNGLIGAWGNKTQWWYYAKKINAQIAAVDAVLMNSVNKGILACGEKAKQELADLQFVMDGTSWRELESVDGNAMVGCFNYQGKTALYVVNYEEAYAQKVTLNLHDSYNLSVTQETKVSKVNTNQLILDLQPGEGVLVVFD